MSEVLTERAGGLPESDDVNDALLKCYRYNPYSEDFNEFKHCLDTVAPVQLHFIPTTTPDVGVAPEHIREQWVGLRLPVRSKHYWEEDGEEGFVVRAREALEVLKRDRPEAYEWWQNYYIRTRAEENAQRKAQYEEEHGRPWEVYNAVDPIPANPDFPEYIANLDEFGFFPRWGVAVPEPEFRDTLTVAEPLYRENYGN